MNYQVIVEKEELIDFINWLPELEDNEKYYLSLFARKKYSPELIKSNDKTQLKRFTSCKERMFDKISQLELPLGRWKLRDMSAPQESLVLYINPNPRNMVKATKLLGKKCWDLVQNKNYNIHAEAMSCIQVSKSRSCFVDFDIDNKDIDFKLLNSIIPEQSYRVLETKGGYHILVDPSKANSDFIPQNYSRDWYKRIVDTFKVDNVGDNMIPVPGTYQGGFVPKFVER